MYFQVYLQYWWAYIQPYKPVTKVKTRGKLMVGMLTIDRDVDIAETVFSKLQDSITYFVSKYPDIKIDVVIITRESDLKSIEFWKTRGIVLTVPHYNIIKRHNMEHIKNKSNILVQYAQKHQYDYLMFVESDVGLHKDTLYELYNLLNYSHGAAACGEVPWAKKTVAYVPELVPRRVRIDEFSKPFVGLGTSTMAVIFNMCVFKDTIFDVAVFDNITGQDVGFFSNMFKNRYKLMISNKEVEHYYNR